MEYKNILRNISKCIRKNTDSFYSSTKIVSNIVNWDLYVNSNNIMLYYPINSEYSLLNLLDNDMTKTFYFPSVVGDNIVVVKLPDNCNEFIKGKYGIKEPVGEIVEDLSSIDMVFLPALAVDVTGHRLGYGKGYYDRFLKSLRQDCIKVVPISEKLVFENIPFNNYDKSFNYIITEEYIKKTSVLKD